jgi:hypothetical protein
MVPNAERGEPRVARAEMPATRMISAGLEASLEHFNDATLLAQGKVNLISLDAVRERLAERWEFKKDQVYGFADRVLERGIGSAGVYLRISDTDFFIVHPDLSALAGQAACLRYLREVLNHFLGDDQMAPSYVLQVTRIGSGALEARPTDLGALAMDADVGGTGNAVAAEVGTFAPQSSRGTAPRVGQERSLDQWSPFVCNDGRELRVSARLEPVYELKNLTRIGFRMIRRVIAVHTEEELSRQQVAALSAADLLRVDIATILRGVGRLKANQDATSSLSLIVPVSFVSLASQRGRAEVVKYLKEAGSLVKLGVICEICDIEGVPPSMLLAAASLVRPFSLLVVGRLNAPTATTVGQLAGAGLQALSFECPRTMGDAEFFGWATAAVGSAKLVAKSVLVYGADRGRIGALASLGASHTSLSSVVAQTPTVANAVG